MNYEHINPNTIEVQVTRQVVLGKQVQMVPSYGYAGVDSGPAKIIGILHHPNESNWHMLEGHEGHLDEVEDSTKAFIDAELSMYNEHTQSHEYQEHYNALHSEPWIAYRYLRGYSDEQPEVYMFPLSLFISHSIPAI